MQNRINLIKMHIFRQVYGIRWIRYFVKRIKKYIDIQSVIRHISHRGKDILSTLSLPLGEICRIMNNIQIIEIYLHRLQKLCVKKRKDLEHLAELQKFSCLSGFFSPPSPKHPLPFFLSIGPHPFSVKQHFLLLFPITLHTFPCNK